MTLSRPNPLVYSLGKTRFLRESGASIAVYTIQRNRGSITSRKPSIRSGLLAGVADSTRSVVDSILARQRTSAIA
ncbi:MAG: hypothetical protein IT335_04190 [Thermomicrobiales bacterium]|jgi:hypothetical protein|nr:hypothetical protein [Thermomicrobiales bacterium]